MSALPEPPFMTLKEYFAFEETSEEKHEYYAGNIYALADGTEYHSLVASTVLGELYQQLTGKPCRPYNSDFRLEIEAIGVYTYPDVSVICGETRHAGERKDTFVNPTVLIEVLSESTEAYDRGKKAEFYRAIPTLREYLLIAQDRPHVEHYRRQEHGWLFQEYASLEDAVVLDSIGCTLPLASIYQRVSFEAPAAG